MNETLHKQAHETLDKLLAVAEANGEQPDEVALALMLTKIYDESDDVVHIRTTELARDCEDESEPTVTVEDHFVITIARQ